MTASIETERILERESDGVLIRNLKGQINRWNRGASNLYGWREDEAVGRISHELLRTQFPRPLEEIDSEVVRNGHWEGKLVHTTRNGSSVVVKSRWVLDSEGQSDTVVEVNTPTGDCNADTKPSIRAKSILVTTLNSIIAGAASLCVLTLFYFLYHYGWVKDRQFSSTFAAALYYGLPTMVAGFLLISALGLKTAAKLNVALICLSIVGSVYAMEFILLLNGSAALQAVKPVMTSLFRSKEKEKDAAELTKTFGVVVDTRSATKVISDMREKGVDAVPVVTPSNDLFIKQPDGSIESALKFDGTEVLPLAGVSSKVTLLCNEAGRWIDYRSDERGFNNPNEIWRSKRLEIAALGDSFVHGYCVPADKNFVALIRQNHPATLNLGIAGDGPLLMLAKINEYLERMKPPIVLWFYYEGNDLTDLQIERNSVLLMNYVKGGFTQSKLAQQTAVDRAIMDDSPRRSAVQQDILARRQADKGMVIDDLVQFGKLSTLRQRVGLVGGVDAETSASAADLKGRNMEVFREILSQAKSRVNAWGGQIYFVYLPEFARYDSINSWGEENRGRVLMTAKDLGIPYLDIDPVFRETGDPLSLFPFRGVGHYNETGHRLVAQEVLKMLSKRASR